MIGFTVRYNIMRSDDDGTVDLPTLVEIGRASCRERV